MYYAHSLEDDPDTTHWQSLEDHLRNVAEKAADFAEVFDARDWGYVAGLWHDVGKYSEKFQQLLFNSGQQVDHSTAGAQHAAQKLGQNDPGKLLAYVIAGHHSGLLDGKSNSNSCLCKRLSKDIPDYSSCPGNILVYQKSLELPFKPDKRRFGFQLSFFVRMLYSCLVDADFLDTEKFMNAEKASWREGYPTFKKLYPVLMEALDCLNRKKPENPINKQRVTILDSCLSAAEKEQGLFSLTVPTGGGKTLSSLAFAMKHALKHNLKRIIYVIPYTSIIEQNAKVFREILGDGAILEHHSTFESKDDDQRSACAIENWDAPIIVTTNVQFFESLFHRKSSKCRKIHNIADSVIILDEAQMLPIPLLKPCIEIIKELSSAYRTTMVLCTATQPALMKNEFFINGLENVREIISDPKKMYTDFIRVNTRKLAEISDDELAEKLNSHDQVLCIVNTRKHARLLYEKISQSAGCFHLSALMCPVHRTEVLEEIKKALLSGTTCRVISTQLIEAGVDIDFPVVYRAAAGIDSVAQAAGRCNREGTLSGKGTLYIFYPEFGLPPGHFRITAETTETVMRHHDDPLSLEAVNEYFKRLYWMKGDMLDEYHILDDLAEATKSGDIPFKKVNEKFKIIKDGSESIIIRHNKDAEKIIEEIRSNRYNASTIRKAQRFIVQVPPKILSVLISAGNIEILQERFYILNNMDLYKEKTGLDASNPFFRDFESMII